MSQTIQISSSSSQELKKFQWLEKKCLIIIKAYLIQRNYTLEFILFHITLVHNILF